MAIVRWNPETRTRTWDPFSELERLSQRIERLFEEMLPVRREDGQVERVWAPSVDVYETDRAFMVEVDLPGLKKEDVKITVENNTLTITGERKWKKEVNDENVHRQERFYGKFVRSFILPDNVDRDNISASFEDGVLTIEIPKRDREERKVVKIK